MVDFLERNEMTEKDFDSIVLLANSETDNVKAGARVILDIYRRVSANCTKDQLNFKDNHERHPPKDCRDTCGL